VTASGLPAKGQYSCAYDMALIAREASLYPAIKKILTLKSATIKTSTGREFKVATHNKMVDSKETPIYGKTGWTKDSENTFAGFAEVSGCILCVAVLGAPKRKILWEEMATLLYFSHDFPHDAPQERKKTQENIATSGWIDIKVVQQILKKKGYYKGEIDGINGPKTRMAVSEFQQQNKLKVDGIVGPNTWKKLQE
jgi:D-alanyl-D-alanine carboxypeptidase